jgi:hypothetical protein
VSSAASSVTGSEKFQLDPLIASVVAERERRQRILFMKLMKLEGFGP